VFSITVDSSGAIYIPRNGSADSLCQGVKQGSRNWWCFEQEVNEQQQWQCQHDAPVVDDALVVPASSVKQTDGNSGRKLAAATAINGTLPTLAVLVLIGWGSSIHSHC
jgi:hypothetical protein